MLAINKLCITQHHLRYLNQIPQMIEFVKQGGIWNTDTLLEHANKYHPGHVSPLIQISHFPDGKDFIHDGHHRLFTTLTAGREFLVPEEYKITDWTYEEYLEINLEAGWFTPFDPRTHCRKANLYGFKKLIRELKSSMPNDFVKIEEIIRRMQDMYCEPRRFCNIAEMEGINVGTNMGANMGTVDRHT